MFPGAQRMNRGNHEMNALVGACKANNVTDLVIIHETRGNPGTHVASVSCWGHVIGPSGFEQESPPTGSSPDKATISHLYYDT